MSNSQQLYNRVSTKLQALHPSLHLKRLAVLVWVVAGLIQGQFVQLSEIANHIPGHTQAVGRISRIRRWFASTWIVSHILYQPLNRGGGRSALETHAERGPGQLRQDHIVQASRATAASHRLCTRSCAV